MRENTNKLAIAALIFSLVFSSKFINAEIYQWTDKNGKVHFSDKPPKDLPSQKRDKSELTRKISSYTRVSVQITPFNEISTSQSNSIVMYATQWCGYCAKARRHFSQNDIDYVEKDIDESQTARQEYDAFGGTGVPVIFAGQYRMNGFSGQRFEKFYNKFKSSQKAETLKN